MPTTNKDAKRANDDMLQRILYRVTRYMIDRLEGRVDPDSPTFISPQELNSMVKLLKDNGIRVKLSDADKLRDPWGEIVGDLDPEDLDVPESYKH